MKRHVESLLLAAMFGAASPSAIAREQPNAALQALDDQLPGDLINDPSNMGWAMSGKEASYKPIRDPAIPGGGAAMSVKVTARGADPWAVQAMVPLLTGVSAGQTVTVGFYARTVSADTADRKALVTIRVQQNVSPYAGFIDKTLAVGPEWGFYEVTGKAARAIGNGQAVVALQLAGARQEIELGQMIVVANADAIATGAPAAPQGPQTVSLPDSLKGKGSLMLDPGKREGWAFYGNGLTHQAGTSNVMGVTSIKAVTAAKTANVYDNAISIPLDAPVKAGDSLIIAIAARTNASDAADAKGQIGLRVMENKEPWAGFGDNQLSFAAGQWQLISTRTQATQDIAAGQAAVQVQLGGAKQDLDIGPVYVLREETAPAP